VLKQFFFLIHFVLMLMPCSFISGVVGIMIDLYCMLFLAAATHSLITGLA